MKTIAFVLSTALAGWLAVPPQEPARPARAVAGVPDGPAGIPNRLIDYRGFAAVVQEVDPLRAKRRLTEAQFLAAMREPGTVVLDARTASRYHRRHLDGAISLPFTEFTAETLAKVIPAKTTRVLIYCNNNFTGDAIEFAEKMPAASLNLSTYVALATYGYTNVWELGPLLDVRTTKLPFANLKVIPIPR
jgi:phage shock protein E